MKDVKLLLPGKRPTPPPLQHTRRRQSHHHLLCECEQGIAYPAACADQSRKDPTAIGRSVRLEPVEDLARSYVARKLVDTGRVAQSTLETHYVCLRGAYRVPPGVVNPALIEAVYAIDSTRKVDMQFESRKGQLKEMVSLAELKEQRDPSSHGYDRPERIHRGMAHECKLHHCKLDFYGKSWIRGHHKETGVPNAERYAHCLEMDHFTPAHYELMMELKEVFRHKLNAASLNAVYNSCVCMISTNMEHVFWHSDTLAGSEADYTSGKMPYVDGAAILVVMKGMRQMLHTRSLLNGPFPNGTKTYNFENIGVPTIELEDGCAYMWPAGAPGLVDWLTEHMTSAHPDGPGAGWKGEEKPKRWAWVFRAIKPQHAMWYARQWPHRACPPSQAEKLYGESLRESVWG